MFKLKSTKAPKKHTIQIQGCPPLVYRNDYYIETEGAAEIKRLYFREGWGEDYHTLLEFEFEADTGVLMSLAILLYEHTHQTERLLTKKHSHGIPVADLHEFSSPYETNHDVLAGFSIGIFGTSLEVVFDVDQSPNKAFYSENIGFFCNDEILLGFKIHGLTKQQIQVMKDCRYDTNNVRGWDSKNKKHIRLN